MEAVCPKCNQISEIIIIDDRVPGAWYWKNTGSLKCPKCNQIPDILRKKKTQNLINSSENINILEEINNLKQICYELSRHIDMRFHDTTNLYPLQQKEYDCYEQKIFQGLVALNKIKQMINSETEKKQCCPTCAPWERPGYIWSYIPTGHLDWTLCPDCGSKENKNEK